MNKISELDWKLLREFKPVALQCASNGETSHQRFLKAFSLIESGNDDIARAFDDMRRSNALERLRAMIAQGLITDEELLRFSPELRSRPLRSRS